MDKNAADLAYDLGPRRLVYGWIVFEQVVAVFLSFFLLLLLKGAGWSTVWQTLAVTSKRICVIKDGLS